MPRWQNLSLTTLYRSDARIAERAKGSISGILAKQEDAAATSWMMHLMPHPENGTGDQRRKIRDEYIYQRRRRVFLPFAKINDIDITETDVPAEYEDMKLSDIDEFTVSIDLSRKQLKKALQIFMLPKWMVTQAVFPRKKKRGRMRRMRHLRRLIQALMQQ